MIREVIKFKDFNGNENTEVCYFHLSKEECTKLEVSHKGGFQNYLKEVVKSEDNAALLDIFNTVILMAYGVKSDDGKYFRKNDSIREEFHQSVMYEALFEKLATDPEAATRFIEGAIGQ